MRNLHLRKILESILVSQDAGFYNFRMKKMCELILLGTLSLSIVGCGVITRSGKAIKQNYFAGKKKLKKGQYDINDRSKKSSGSLDELRSMNNSKIVGQLIPEDEIVWAPEDPNEPIVGLDDVVTKSNKPVDTWFVNYKKAMQASRVEGKPLLIWFTSTRNSPFDVALSNELFSTSNFNKWAEENLVRLRIDSNVIANSISEREKKKDYIKSLKKRYKVMGNPVVLVLSPRGTVFGTYRGYKPGEVDYYYGRLRNAQRAAQNDYNSWKNEMEAKGYRVWHDLRGKSVFAKPVRYRASSGKIWLVEPDGRKSVTTIDKLSLEDRLYVEQKAAESKRR